MLDPLADVGPSQAGWQPWGQATARAKPPLEQVPEQKVTSLGQSHRSSKCQSKRLPPWGKATARASARAKGYLPGAKPPLEQVPEQKVTSLEPLFANRISLIHSGQAGQGAGRGPGVRPTIFAGRPVMGRAALKAGNRPENTS